MSLSVSRPANASLEMDWMRGPRRTVRSGRPTRRLLALRGCGDASGRRFLARASAASKSPGLEITATKQSALPGAACDKRWGG